MAWTLVTGGAKRLGAEICLTLAKQGHALAIHYHTSEESAHSLVKLCHEAGAQAECIQGDFSTPQSTNDFIKRYLLQFPNTKNVINNVGNYLIKSALSTSVDEWATLFQTNLYAPIAIINALISSITEYRGNIINLGVTGIQNIPSSTYSTAYTSSKLALWMLTRSLAAELASRSVRVNMVSPGYLDISVNMPSNVNLLPMHRLGSCSEVARVVAFLLDPKSEYITGQNIEVAGGVGL